MSFDVRSISAAPDAIAPYGSEIRTLCATGRGSMALFRLAPGIISRAVAHRSVEELWYVTRGRGRIWRKSAEREAVAELAVGTLMDIPCRALFQFANDGAEPVEL